MNEAGALQTKLCVSNKNCCRLIACAEYATGTPKAELLLLLSMCPQSVKVVLGDGSSSSGGSGIQGSSSSGGSGGLNTYQARIIGTDAMHDLAVLQVS